MLHPALLMLLGALLIGPARGLLRSTLVLLVPLCTLALIWQVPDGIQMSVEFLQYPIEPVEVHYGVVTNRMQCDSVSEIP